MAKKNKGLWTVYKRCLWMALQNKTALLIIFLFSLASASLSIVSSMTLKYIVDIPVLFEASIRNNFLRVEPNLTEPEIWALLDSVGLKQVIESKKEGLDSPINRKESVLSGGEYRRLCLAVFLAKKADVLLFDEPTASLDAQSAENIVKVLQKLARENHSLVIATHDALLKDLGEEVLHFG